MRTRAEIVERARVHVGHSETSENDSILIRAWLRLCGVASPAPWCAAFASWCLGDRAMAGALKLGRSFPATLNPQPGDLMYFATGGGKGHIGIVVAVSEDEVLCIEGNRHNRIALVRRLRSEVLFSRTRAEDWEGPQLDLGPSERWPLARRTIEGTR